MSAMTRETLHLLREDWPFLSLSSRIAKSAFRGPAPLDCSLKAPPDASSAAEALAGAFRSRCSLAALAHGVVQLAGGGERRNEAVPRSERSDAEGHARRVDSQPPVSG